MNILQHPARLDLYGLVHVYGQVSHLTLICSTMMSWVKNLLKPIPLVLVNKTRLALYLPFGFAFSLLFNQSYFFPDDIFSPFDFFSSFGFYLACLWVWLLLNISTSISKFWKDWKIYVFMRFSLPIFILTSTSSKELVLCLQMVGVHIYKVANTHVTFTSELKSFSTASNSRIHLFN